MACKGAQCRAARVSPVDRTKWSHNVINEFLTSVFLQEVQNLSGGELQRVAMTLCLGKPADVYLIDEPSAYLDSEQRLVSAKVLFYSPMHRPLWH